MTDIENRDNIYQLVSGFYALVRKDELLGPIFNRSIADHEWEPHLQNLTDFWFASLLSEKRFFGSPTKAHIAVDKANDHKISQLHFHRWLELWISTIDSLYAGEQAERAKAKARQMATGQYISIFRSRPGQ